jgi:DNA transformation protein
LVNLGPRSSAWLSEVGIETEADLQQLGAVEAYQRVKAAFPREVSLNMLYALEGALRGIRWDRLSVDQRVRLRRQAGID